MRTVRKVIDDITHHRGSLTPIALKQAVFIDDNSHKSKKSFRKCEKKLTHWVNHCCLMMRIIPSAMKITAYLNLQALICSMKQLEKVLEMKSSEFEDLVKLERTCLQDALPLTLGQEFGRCLWMYLGGRNYMNNVDKIVDESRKSINIINNCTFEVPEQIAEFFIHYTAVIWDFKMVGTIYDLYSDDIIVHREGGSDIVSVEHVISDTLAMLAAFSDLKLVFYNIFAVRNEDEGYRFGQAVYFEGTNDGYSKYGPPTGRKLTKENCLGLCECIVKQVDGRWKIVEEWVTRSADTVEKVLKGEIDEHGNIVALENAKFMEGACGPL